MVKASSKYQKSDNWRGTTARPRKTGKLSRFLSSLNLLEITEGSNPNGTQETWISPHFRLVIGKDQET